MKIKDKTVYQNLGSSGFGGGANCACVDVKDGRVARVRPIHYDEQYTPEDLNAWKIEAKGKTFEPGFKSFLPPLSIGYKMRAYSPNRIPYPLKRVDWDPKGERNPQNRGKSKFERISWDEAATYIADEIVRIHEEYSPEAILCCGEGHGQTKCVAGGHGCMTMMFDQIGGYTCAARQPDSWEGWYWGAKHVWGMDPVGQCTSQFNVFEDISKNGDAVLFWGADPETTPWGWGGQQSSRMCYWLNDIGVQSIFICPDVNYASAVHNDKWIPVLPNTDAALQLGIVYVWVTEGTYEKDYLDTHAVGFDWLESYVLGYIDGVAKTPQWAAEKCGVPSYRIKALARYWADHKVSIAHCNGGGYIRSAYSHEPARLEVCLLAMQALGKPGAHVFKFIEWNLFGIEENTPIPPSKVIPSCAGGWHGWMMQPPKVPFIPKTMIPKAILHREEFPLRWYGRVTACLPRADQYTPYQYPNDPDCDGLHMIWTDTPCWETCWNGGNLYQDALRDESIQFIVAQHPWLENDCLFADIILPVTSVFEDLDFSTDANNGQWACMLYEEQAIDRIGEAKSDYRAVAEVCKKLEEHGGIYEGLYEKYTKGLVEEQDVENAFKMSGIDTESNSFEDFKERGFHLFPTREDYHDFPTGMEAFFNDPDSNPVDTPSGKLEIYSSAIAQVWPDDDERGPYPKWVEETPDHHERVTSDRAKDYPFLLMSNHPRWRVHAEHDDIPWLREIPTCKVTGPDGYAYEPIWVNPLDAERLGLKDGDIAKLYNERGGVLGGVWVTERIMPGVLYQDHGARVDTIVPGKGGLDRGGANNLIAPDKTTSKNAPGEVTNGFLVGIEKVDVFELAQQYPEAFARPYNAACGLTCEGHIA